MPNASTIILVVLPLIILATCFRVEFGRIKGSVRVTKEQPLWRRLTTHLVVITVNGRTVNLSPALWASAIVALIVWFL